MANSGWSTVRQALTTALLLLPLSRTTAAYYVWIKINFLEMFLIEQVGEICRCPAPVTLMLKIVTPWLCLLVHD